MAKKKSALTKSTKSSAKVSETKSHGPAVGQTAELLRELFQAAINLRGSIEPADYKRYVLPIVFLRFLSLNFEKRRAKLEALIADPESEYFTKDPKVARQILEDADEYQAAGSFIIPVKARWSTIVKNAAADDIKVQLDDALEAIEDAYPDKLRGLLPRIYAGANLDRENVTGLINLFSKDIFERDHGGEDLIGRVYEYFIGEFANSEGKRGGEFFTPVSIVRTLVAMLEPTSGTVFDPCCGSGGMFVQSDVFTQHSGALSFYGQESKDFTYRLCKMNLFIHGIWGDIRLGNSYAADQHPTLRADYIIANPPFNDGSKGDQGWGASKIVAGDPRLNFANRRKANGESDPMPLAVRNANTMWMMHFLYHLSERGSAGFVMATGELSNNETARFEVRKALVDLDYVDCVVQLTGQLFANTQIPCSLWLLSKNRDGKSKGFRKRVGQVLFIDGRKFGSLIPGSRKQKQLSAAEIEQIAVVYRQFKTKANPQSLLGFCHVATLEQIQEHNYALTPGRYVGSQEVDDEDEPFEERFPKLVAQLEAQFAKSRQLEKAIRAGLKEVADGI